MSTTQDRRVLAAHISAASSSSLLSLMKPTASSKNRPHPLSLRSSALKQPLQHRIKPLIIHLYSPDVIHVPASQFREVVQRLTGSSSQSQARQDAIELPVSSSATSPAPSKLPDHELPSDAQSLDGGVLNRQKLEHNLNVISTGTDHFRDDSSLNSIYPPPQLITSYDPAPLAWASSLSSVVSVLEDARVSCDDLFSVLSAEDCNGVDYRPLPDFMSWEMFANSPSASASREIGYDQHPQMRTLDMLGQGLYYSYPCSG